jgi:hypothetical protein
MTKFLVFGDSFPAGCDLADTDCRFPKLIADGLGWELIDFSQGSSSIDHAVHFFMSWIQKQNSINDTVALFCLTDPSRTMYFDEHDNLRELTPHSNNTLAQYYKIMLNPKTEQHIWIKNITLLNLLCKHHSIPAYFINNWAYSQSLVDYVDCAYPESICEILGFSEREWDYYKSNPFEQVDKSGKYFDRGCYHPNVQGHKKIAETLTEWLKNYG